jgi:hypothetical protein
MTNTLQWHEHHPAGGVIYSAFTQRGRYDITDTSKGDPRNPRWYTRRMDHPLMPPFDGFCPTLDAAKRACENDFIALQRADRWLDHMRDNEPPA